MTAQRWSCLVRAFVGAAVLLCGCSAQSAGRPSSEIASAAAGPTGLVPSAATSVAWTPTTHVKPIELSDKQLAEMRLKWLDDLRAGFNLPAMTYPSLVRYVEFNEIASVLVPCLRSKGFIVAGSADGGGISTHIDPSQNEPFARAQVECYAMYTPDPRNLLPPTVDQKRVIYEYYSQFVIPCVRKQGFSINNLPSEAVWVADPKILEGYPWGNDQVLKACPINVPPAAYLGSG